VPLYKVIFLGSAVAGPEEETRLIDGLKRKFSLTAEKAERLFQRVPIVVKKSGSREELEKYVQAFKEIGGRARIEEELVEEVQESSKAPEPEKGRYLGAMITCPQCGFEQPEADECTKCGVVISKYRQYKEAARPAEPQVREIMFQEQVPAWESGEGFIGAFFKTVGEALFSPAQFFKKVGNGEGYLSPLVYGVICGIIGLGVEIVWDWFFLSILSERFALAEVMFQYYHATLNLMIFSLPLKAVLYIVIASVIVHFCLMMVGGNRNGFQRTFRTVAYSFTACLWLLVPFIGSIIILVYLLTLLIIGAREGHGISTGRAALAILLPGILIFGLGIIAAIFIPLFFSSMGGFRGVGV
jgi:hypothetical protein